MGIAKAPTKLLLQESLRKPLEGRVLQLGRQTVFVTEQELRGLAAKIGAKLQDIDEVKLSWDPNYARLKYLSDDSYFRLLGFSQCESLDNFDYEGAMHILDLNVPEVPDNLRNRFDFIVDGGTIEHVFHVPNVLNNIFSMLKVGGRILHISPSSNHMDHGFYMFSPTFFLDFYAANKFEINLAQVARYTRKPDVHPWLAMNYTPGSLDRISVGGLDDGLYAIFFLATKTAQSTGTAIPQQNFYMRVFAPAPAAATTPTAAARWSRTAKTLLKTMPGFRYLDAARQKLIAFPRLVRYKLDALLPSRWKRGVLRVDAKY